MLNESFEPLRIERQVFTELGTKFAALLSAQDHAPHV